MSETARQIADLTIIDVVGGRTSCSGCKYVLTGQPVRHDPVYQLRVVQCPECGTVHAVPMHRTTSARPQRRIGRVQIALSAVLLLGLAGFAGGLAQSTGFAASVPVARQIARASGQHEQIFARINLESWHEQRESFSSALQAAGVGFDVAVLTDLFWLVPVIPLLVGLIACCLPAVRRPGLLLLGLLSMALASIGLTAYYVASYSEYGFEYAINLAEWSGGYWFGIFTMVVAGVYTLVCLVVARPVVRRVLAAFGFTGASGGTWLQLWTADGLRPPSAKRPSQGPSLAMSGEDSANTEMY